jgi:hypothetical protein
MPSRALAQRSPQGGRSSARPPAMDGVAPTATSAPPAPPRPGVAAAASGLGVAAASGLGVTPE